MPKYAYLVAVNSVNCGYFKLMISQSVLHASESEL